MHVHTYTHRHTHTYITDFITSIAHLFSGSTDLKLEVTLPYGSCRPPVLDNGNLRPGEIK